MTKWGGGPREAGEAVPSLRDNCSCFSRLVPPRNTHSGLLDLISQRMAEMQISCINYQKFSFLLSSSLTLRLEVRHWFSLVGWGGPERTQGGLWGTFCVLIVASYMGVCRLLTFHGAIHLWLLDKKRKREKKG